MGAGLLDQTDAAVGIAEGDEILAEQLHTDGRAIGLRDLFGQECGQPVATEDLAHRGIALDAGEQIILLGRDHGACPPHGLMWGEARPRALRPGA